MEELRRQPSGLSYILTVIIGGCLTVLSLVFVFRYVDLSPRVNEHFFFSTNDPQLRNDRLISRIFLQEPELILSIKGDIRSPVYLAKVSELTAALSSVPEIDSVQSLMHGPGSVKDALTSPLWKRFLFSRDHSASFIYIFIKRDVPVEDGVRRIEEIKQRFDSTSFPLVLSGAPYIVELIQRALLRDLKVFSIAAFCAFGLLGFLISRSVAMVLGTLIACANASALTLIVTREFNIPIGPLTANLATIVFVLTLTHMVFMTFNWRHIISKKEAGIETAWKMAVRVTVQPSVWSMLTQLLGFLSLLSVPAAPLRQLGMSGSMGTVIAFLCAYIIYPFFLRLQTSGAAEHRPARPSFFARTHGRIAAAILVAAVIASIGILKLDTEPSLFSYFGKGSDLRNSLEYIDRNGGSSPLKIVLRKRDKAPFKMGEDYQRLWRLQTTLEQDPSVGSIISLPLLLAEAKRSPLVSVVPVWLVLDALKSPLFGKTALYYITKDQTMTLFVLRMKETYRQSDHMANIERLKSIIRRQGFEPEMVGGTYLLYGKLTMLVASSVMEGLTLLIILFMIMGGVISRSLRIVGAMFISLGIVPLLLLGVLGYCSIPLDIISAPAGNISIGIGVDAMIHVLIWVRRHPAGSMGSRQAWADVCSRLWKPITYSMSVVCAGFAIFLLSGFPPTQRFGFSVVLGTILSPLPALFVLPWLATLQGKEQSNQ